MSEDLTRWADALESAIARHGVRSVLRVGVVAETASTQDAALRLAGGRAGLLVVAGRQTGGRGRLGRRWDDGKGLGLAATFVLAHDLDAAHVALAAGLAAAQVVDDLRPVASRGGARAGLRWPNDVVMGDGRKLAGVLIERRAGLTLAGIGLNVGQGAGDWDPVLRGRGVSLRELGSRASRLEAAERLIIRLDGALALSPASLAEHWRERDVLRGTEVEFVSDGRRVRGVVERIDPAHALHVRTRDGRVECLAAATTSLVHGEA